MCLLHGLRPSFDINGTICLQEYTVSFEAMRRNEELNPWAAPVMRHQTPPPVPQSADALCVSHCCYVQCFH